MTVDAGQELILHGYPLSTFTEKIKRILAFKTLDWRAVEIPNIMPKPKLMPLTAGYRRTPVLQIGSDIYCDTALIVRKLEEYKSSPSIFPGDTYGVAQVIADWADRHAFFWSVLPTFSDIMPSFSIEFMADRMTMSSRFEPEKVHEAAPQALANFELFLDRIESMLGARPFILGEQFSLADASCYHITEFTRNSDRVFGKVRTRPALMSWIERVGCLSGGRVEPMSEDEALEVARRTEACDHEPVLVSPNDLALGMTVAVAPDDYGCDPAKGELVMLAADEVAIASSSEDAGDIVVHFPRNGYLISKC